MFDLFSGMSQLGLQPRRLAFDEVEREDYQISADCSREVILIQERAPRCLPDVTECLNIPILGGLRIWILGKRDSKE